MSTKEEVYEQLRLANEAVAKASVLVNQLPSDSTVKVKPGDNLLSLIDSNPAGTEFQIDNDFVQNIQTVSINKPCKLKSQRANLIGDLTLGAPDISLYGIIIDGLGATILTAGLRSAVDACTLRGHAKGQHRGIATNNEGIRIRDSRILNIWKDIDTQAIGGWNKTKDLVVQRCELEASGENFMLGGTDSDDEASMPRNVLVEFCTMSKRLEWREDPNATCKNLLELKACDNVIVRNCTMEYSFVDGQTGFGIKLAVRNQDGKAPWSNITNTLFESNIVRHVAGGIAILGRDYEVGKPSGIMNNVKFLNNTLEDINQNIYGENGQEFIIAGGPKNFTFDGNKFSGTNLNGLYFDNIELPCENFQALNNYFIEGHYGIFGAGAGGLGKIVLDKFAPGYTWTNNTVKKSHIRDITWPPGTILVD